VQRQPGPDLDHYPPGASPDARYYQDHHSRTGWYALAAFIALIALVAGGVLVYQSLTKEQGDTTASSTLGNYVNRRLADVTAELDQLGLQYQAIAEPNAQFNEDFVWKTDPEAGTVVVEGQIIKLYYNPTKALVAVPNVAGRPVDEAKAILGQNGFQYTEESEESSVPVGRVIRTDPPADTLVAQQTVVKIFVSAGPNQVSVPSIIINQTADDARNLLESDEYGLVVEIKEQVDSVVEVGRVIGTNPAPNTLVDRGSTITLFVSSGPGQVRVPPLVGLTEGQARNKLDELGLGVNATFRELPPGDPRDGTVLEQSIKAAAIVDVGTVIDIVIGQATVAATTTSTTTTTTTTTVPATTAPPPTTAP
jgi:serine/threonine-protein kinase